MRNWSVVIFSFLFLFFLQKEFPAKNMKTEWESRVRNQIMQSEYFTRPVKNNFEFTNRAKNIRAKIAQTTFEVSSRDERWKISYDLIGFGKNNQIIKPSSLIASAKGPNLSLKNTQLEIYYHNSTAGIRQDFIIYQKPIGQGDLQLYLNVETPFDLYVSDSKVVHSEKNKIMASYENLNVFDARGMKLDAKFVLANHQLKIEVKDQFAQYPIRIDPLTTTPSWVVEQNQANASFGYTVSYVGDVNGDGFGDVLIGAPYFDNGFTDEGRVFLYYGSVNGLQSTVAWSYSCGKVDCQLGYSIDGAGKINNDVYADIIIGAPNYSNGQVEEGAAFIFHGSANGLSATPNRILESNIAGIHFGMSVSGNAKFNNDNFSDIAIGAPHYSVDFSNRGAVYAYWGSTSGISTTVRSTLKGDTYNVQLGQVVKVLGDVNKDGFSDLIASAPSDSNGESNEGRVFLYLGSAGGLGASASWSGESNSVNAFYGESIAAADINHDGLTDLVVGAPRYSDSYSAQGAVYVYYANGTTFNSTPNVSFYGNSSWEYFGGGLFCGDVNGDSFAEIIVSALYYSGANADEGKVYVFYGTAFGIEQTARWTKVGGSSEASFGQGISVGDVNGDSTPDLIISSGYESNGQIYEGRVYAFHGTQRGLNTQYSSRFNFSQGSSQYGFAISSAGDVNNDGFDDLLVGAYNFDNGQTNEGKVFLYLGGANGVSTTEAWSYESNQASATLGIAMAGNCDVNGDGYSDVFVGANKFDNGQSNEGRVFGFYGSNTGLSSSPQWINESNVASGQYGRSLHCRGDFNGDGFNDLIVGAPNYKNTLSNEGKVFLYKGSSLGVSTTPYWTFVSAQATSYAGFDVSFLGDVNNDGNDEFGIGAYAYDKTLTNEGAVFFFYGSTGVLSTQPDWSYYGGVASAQFGYSLSYAKKLNNDDFDDFIVGAPGFKKTLTTEGGVFIFYGASSGPQSPLVAVGGQASANLGKKVTSAGDVDGDGFDDIAIAAPMYDNGQTNEGRVYIYLGSSVGISITSSWQAEGNLASGQFGQGLAGDFDMNGDGFDDLVIGAPVYKITSNGDGAVFSFYGSAN